PVVVASTNSTNFSGTKEAAGQYVKKDVSSLRYIVLPNWFHEAYLKSSTSNAQDTCSADAPESSGNSNPTATSTNPPADHMKTLAVETLIPTVSSPVLTACLNDSPEPSSDTRLISKRVTSQDDKPSLDNILTLTNKFEDILGVTINTDDTNGVEADLGNMETTITASPTPTLRIHKDYPKSQIIGPVDTLIQTRNKSKEMEEQGFIATIHQKTNPTLLQFCLFLFYQIDVKSAFLYGTIDKEVYVTQPHGFQDLEFPAIVYKVEKAMYGLHQAPRAWYGTLSKYLLTNSFQRGTIDQTLFIRRHIGDFILIQVYVDDIIFGSSNRQLCREFKAVMHEKFQMSVMGELNFFLGLQVLQKKDGIFLSQDKYVGDILKKFEYSDVRSANTPMDKENPWGKDETRKDVDLHHYRSMIGSLMYLTSSRPDIMFTVCACDRHQVTPKESYSDSDYSGASQDRKSTTGGCQFFGRRLISWQCKKQTIVATSTTEAEYVAAGQVLWIQNQLLDYGRTRIAQSLVLPPVVDEPASPLRDDSQGEACPTGSGFGADQDRANIAKTSTLPSDLTPRVTLLTVDKGSIQQKLDELTALYTNLQRQQSEMVSKFATQELEITTLKARVKLLEDREGGGIAQSGDDAPIKGRSLDEGEEAAKRVSDDIEEMETVLTSMDVASILTSRGVQVVPTVAEVATATVSIPTGSGLVSTASLTIPTAALIFTTATDSIPYTRRKRKEKMVESNTPKKKKLQEQIDV
nr:uncharacterized mitochondrial protein AtMg00810-like [Tanacetum cinerariifolium]